MNIHIAFGKDICFALWEEDFAQMIRLASECNGDIFTLNLQKINQNNIANLLNTCKEYQYWAFISQDQMNFINKLEKNI